MPAFHMGIERPVKGFVGKAAENLAPQMHSKEKNFSLYSTLRLRCPITSTFSNHFKKNSFQQSTKENTSDTIWHSACFIIAAVSKASLFSTKRFRAMSTGLMYVSLLL